MFIHNHFFSVFVRGKPVQPDFWAFLLSFFMDHSKTFTIRNYWCKQNEIVYDNELTDLALYYVQLDISTIFQWVFDVANCYAFIRFSRKLQVSNGDVNAVCIEHMTLVIGRSVMLTLMDVFPRQCAVTLNLHLHAKKAHFQLCHSNIAAHTQLAICYFPTLCTRPHQLLLHIHQNEVCFNYTTAAF